MQKIKPWLNLALSIIVFLFLTYQIIALAIMRFTHSQNHDFWSSASLLILILPLLTLISIISDWIRRVRNEARKIQDMNVLKLSFEFLYTKSACHSFAWVYLSNSRLTIFFLGFSLSLLVIFGHQPHFPAFSIVMGIILVLVPSYTYIKIYRSLRYSPTSQKPIIFNISPEKFEQLGDGFFHFCRMVELSHDHGKETLVHVVL